jgi:hypothetical protein
MNDSTTILGTIGTIASFTLGQWNNVVGITAGLFTIAWVIFKFIRDTKE